MIVFAEIFAAVAYLLPVVVWSSLRWERSGERDASFAIELAVAVAIDLLSVLVLARLFTLETATLVSRAAWAVVAGIAVGRWWRAGGRPRRLTASEWRRVLELGLVVAAALLLSTSLSRPCAIWDREWHIPLVSALRGQRLPFMNVFDPAGGLYYHFAGDVQAAMLQTLSGGRLHASLALSLLHDVMFSLLALNVVCFARALGLRRATLAALVFFAVVLIGPVTLLRDDVRKLDAGFSLVNLLTLSFRPHVALAYLLGLTFLEIVVSALRADDPSPRWRARLAALAALAAALAITDETSLGLMGLAVGALWLTAPTVLAPTRRTGVLALGVLAAAIVAAVVTFGGSIGPSAPHFHIGLAAPRAPAYAGQSVSLATAEGWMLIVQDLLPVLGVLVGVVVVAVRCRDRVTTGVAVLYATLATTSIFALTFVDFEGQAYENHRFATAMFVAAPLLAVAALARQARVSSLGVAAGGVGALLVFLSIGVGVASTIEWLGSGVAYRQCAQPGFAGWGSERFYELDCRRETGARLGEATVSAYADMPGLYLWAGCHPTFVPTSPVGPGGHKIKIGGAWSGMRAFEQLRRRMPAPTDRLTVACLAASAAGPNRDFVCARAAALGPCQPAGASFTTCSLDGPARAAVAR